jgi:hypothetical protein
MRADGEKTGMTTNKAALRQHTEKLAKTYDDLKGIFGSSMSPALAQQALATYDLKALRTNLVEQVRSFRQLRDGVLAVDRELADIYDLAMAANQKTIELVDRIVRVAGEPVA